MRCWLSRNISYFRSANFFFIGTLFVQAHGMDEPPIAMFNRYAWQVILVHAAGIIERSSIRNFSEVNKSCNKLVFETRSFREKFNDDHRALVLVFQTAEYRKRYFMQLYPHLQTIDDIVWNKHGTVCAKVSYGSELNYTLCHDVKLKTTCSGDKKVLIERRNFLNPCDIAHKTWPYFHKALPHRPTICFDGLHDVYFYAYGSGFAVATDLDAHVIEYRLPSKPSTQPDAFICMTKIGDKYIKLTAFLEFPFLLEAFLNSSVIKYPFSIAYKIFMLEGVTIPENYRTCQKYLEKRDCKSFKDLPKEIRKPIVALYNSQHEHQAKKKKKKWIFF